METETKQKFEALDKAFNEAFSKLVSSTQNLRDAFDKLALEQYKCMYGSR